MSSIASTSATSIMQSPGNNKSVLSSTEKKESPNSNLNSDLPKKDALPTDTISGKDTTVDIRA